MVDKCAVCSYEIVGNFYRDASERGVCRVTYYPSGVGGDNHKKTAALPYRLVSTDKNLPIMKKGAFLDHLDKIFCTRGCHDKFVAKVYGFIPNSLPETWIDSWKEAIYHLRGNKKVKKSAS